MLAHAHSALGLLLFFLSLARDAAAGPHAYHQHRTAVRTVHRRHQARSIDGSLSLDQPLRRRSSSCSATSTTSGSCTEGNWQCVGSELQRCYNDQWNNVRNCTGADVVCSASSEAIGCVWSWSVDNSTSSTDPGSSYIAPSNSTTDPEDGDGYNTTESSTSTTAFAATSTSTGGRHHGNTTTSASLNTTTSAPVSKTSSAVTGHHTSVSTNGTTSSNTTNTNTTSGSLDIGSISAPHFVVYADNWLEEMPTVDALAGYNRFVLAFWMVDSGAVDNAQAWEGFSASYRKQVLEEYHAAGIALMVSAFGSTDTPTTSGADPVTVAQDLAAWVKKYGLDGVDIDYEDFDAFNSGKSEDWVSSLQTELRNQLPAGEYVISHAPVAPWFTDADIYQNGGYIAINSRVGSTIDWYNVQFYNQGANMYNTCDNLVDKSGGDWPHTAVMELNAHAGVEMNKIVIGKPMTADAASDGYMSSDLLENCVAQARGEGWGGGVMFWEWPNNMEIQSLTF